MKTRRMDCLVAGDANADLLIDGIAKLEFEKEKLATDMNLVLGGSSSIFAFNLARLGAKVGFVGVVGDDFFGTFVTERLRWAGVDVHALRRLRHTKTGLTIWCNNGGQRAGMTYNGTIAMVRARDVDRELRSARHLHVGAYFLLEELHSGAAALFRRAKKLGLTTSLDCNYDPAETWDSGIRQVLQFTDVFFPNEIEALRLTNSPNVEHAGRELAKLARIAVVKLGSRGALVCTQGKQFRVPAVKTRVVDTTGAGDSFDAGFLASWCKGATLETSARAGAAAGARAVRAVGGTGAFE
jgi:sugar/nucleoside kinase (ribokinase family)